MPGGKRSALVSQAEYGRTECVEALVAAAGRGVGQAASGTKRRRSAAPPVSAREGRNAQRVLDAILGSAGEWVEVSYE